MIKAVFQESRQTYGSPRMHKELVEKGVPCSENTVAKDMRRLGVRVKPKKGFVRTTDSKHDLPIAPNHLKRRFHADRPNEKWVGDMTYVRTDEGWLYLAAVEDLFSRKIVGWFADDHMRQELILGAMQQAVVRRGPPDGLLMHSDRGSQYASKAHRTLLEESNATCSMSRKGDCWDNAPMESFFATLKKELIYRQRFATRAEAKAAIADYIETFYNAQRRHSSLDYVSPNAFETEYARKRTP